MLSGATAKSVFNSEIHKVVFELQRSILCAGDYGGGGG